jgi:RNA polymerase sigma-70 factor (ECF subfamily)
MELTDFDKILAIKKNNEFLVGKIYGLYRNEFLFFLKKRTSINPDDILEIYQDAFMVLCNKIYENKLDADNLTSSLKSYLFGVGIRIAYNVNRKNGKLHAQDLNEAPRGKQQDPNENYLLSSQAAGNQILKGLKIEIPDMPDDEPNLGEENEKIIQKAVHEMGEPCHTILVKQYWEDKRSEEIAIEMNYKNTDTAKTQKYKCIQKLKNELRGKIVYQS